MKVLALDFDGVLSDSAPESFEVARRTYLDLRPDSSLRDRDREQVFAAFLDLMPLGNRAEDYGTALAAIEAGVALPDQDAYDAYRAGQDADWMRSYHRRFYQVRTAFSKDDPRGWRELLRPYSHLLDILRRRAGEVEYAIATAKDRRSVGMLLDDYGVRDLFPPGRVLDKETGVSKQAHFEHLRGALSLDYAEMTFVDDKVNHLDSVAPLGVRCVLAAWGYNGPREHRLALERGYRVCKLETAERELFGPA